jgi:hypothetical protein
MKLKNGSQVAVRPARKPTEGSPGYFSESNDSGAPSYPGQDWFNDQIDEFQNALAAAGVAYDSSKLTNLAEALGKLTRSKSLMDVSGTADAIILTTPAGKQPVTTLNDYDEFSFIVAATNTATVTIKVDALAAKPLAGIVSDTQIFETALLTVRYIAGSFYIANQINPKTGNPVALIGEIISSPFAGVGACKMRFDSGELSRATHPILFAKAQKTGLIDQATKDADLQEYGGKWGDGDGATTFTVPIYDGTFLRIADNGRGFDVGRMLGTWQGDAIQNIEGGFSAILPNVFESGLSGPFEAVYTSNGTSSGTNGNLGIKFDASNVVPTAADNRPMNYSINAAFLV